MTKILIIDDDDFLLDMYITKFTQIGFKIDSAKDGKEALDKIKNFDPDIVLLDMVMPGVDGFEVLKSINEIGLKKKPKIIVLSNLDQRENIDKALKLGAHDYMIKSDFTPSEIAEKVKKLLE